MTPHGLRHSALTGTRSCQLLGVAEIAHSMAKPMSTCRHVANWTSRPTVSILILNHNGAVFTPECVKSVATSACDHVEVLLVDNASSDNSVELALNTYPGLRVVRHRRNLGYGQAYNLSVEHARGVFLVFLNNDTLVDEGWLDPLIRPLEEDRRVAVTTSKLLIFGTRVMNAAGGCLRLWTGSDYLGFGEDEAQFSRGFDPFFGCGAAMAIRRSLFEQLGGFDGAMFAYAEDLDLCWRARLLGYRIVYCPNSVVHHHISGSWQRYNPAKLRMLTHHNLRAMLKCLSLMNLLHSVPMFIGWSLAKGLGFAILRKDLRFILSVLAGCVDFATNLEDALEQRRGVQRVRSAPDRVVLRSEGFRLYAPLSELWRRRKMLKWLDALQARSIITPR